LKAVDAQKLEIAIPDAAPVSALLIRPARARAAYVFAHGAGAGMTHASMQAIAGSLSDQDMANLAAYYSQGGADTNTASK